MPTYLTYSSLISDLQSYLERGTVITDPTVYNQLPRLINNAERAIVTRLKIQGNITPLNSVFAAGQAVYAKPDRWRRTVSMNFGTLTNQNYRAPIFPRSYEYVRGYWPDDTQTAPPEYYADYDDQHWLIVPTPDQAYPWEPLVYQLPALLDTTNQTNWVTQYAPNALLYRALLETAPFIRNDSRIQTWEKFYEDFVSQLDTEDMKKIIDRAIARNEA